MAVLSTLNPTLVGAKKELDRRIPPGADLAERFLIGQEVFSDEKYFRDVAVPRVDLFHNFYAVEPRVDDDVFRGPHDRQWDADGGVYKLVWTGPRYPSEVKGARDRDAD